MGKLSEEVKKIELSESAKQRILQNCRTKRKTKQKPNIWHDVNKINFVKSAKMKK